MYTQSLYPLYKSAPIHQVSSSAKISTRPTNAVTQRLTMRCTQNAFQNQNICPFQTWTGSYSKSSGLFTGDARIGLPTTGLDKTPLVEILSEFLIKSPVLDRPARSRPSGSTLSTGAYSCSIARCASIWASSFI